MILMMMFYRFGPVPWVPDITPLASFSGFIRSFIITFVFAATSLHLGMTNCFLILSLIYLCASVFIFCFVSENNGNSLQVIAKW
jgi:hypothetical protein